MAFDPSIISQIPDMAPNPVAAQGEAYKLKDLQTNQQSNSLKLSQDQKQVADQDKARNILKGTKLDSPEDVTKAAEKLTNAGLPDQAMNFMKTMQGLQESKGNLTEQQYRVLGQKSDIIGSTVGSLVNESQQLIQSGQSPAMVNALMQPKYQAAIQQLHNQKLGDGSPALNAQDLQQIEQHPQFDANFLRSIADRSKQGSAAIKAQLDFHKSETADKALAIKEADEERKEKSDAETERKHKADEEQKAKGIPDQLSGVALDLARDNVMADPSSMRQYASYSSKDPRKNQINEAIAAKLKEGGMGFPDLVRLRTRFSGEKKSVEKLIAQRDGIEAFEGLARANGERALELLKMVDDTGVPMIEGFTRSAKRKAGNVDAGELASVLNSFQTETARVIGGNPNMTGVVTDSARKDVQALVPQSSSVASGIRNISRLLTEMDIRRDMVNSEIDRGQKSMTDISPNSPLPQRNPSGSLVAPGAAPAAPLSQTGAPPAVTPQPAAAAQPGGAPAAAPPAGGTDFSHLWNGPAAQ